MVAPELRPSFVDAANPCVSSSMPAIWGLTATELPGDIALRSAMMLEALEADIAVTIAAMFGRLGGQRLRKQYRQSVPKIAHGRAVRAMPMNSLREDTIRAADCDVQVRMISMGASHIWQFH